MTFSSACVTCARFSLVGLCIAMAGCGDSSGSDSATTSGAGKDGGSTTQACAANCIEADIEMPDGSKQHLRREAAGASAPSLHVIGVGSIQASDESGIYLAVDTTKVQRGTPIAAVDDPADGPSFSIKIGGQPQVMFKSTGGQVVFTAVSETSGSPIDGTFDGIVATRSGSAEVVKVTNGVFHSAAP